MKWSKFLNSEEDNYVPGDWNAICDASGRKVRASQLVRQWNGMMVRPEMQHFRNDQDFLKTPKEQGIPWARPEPEDVFGQTDAEDL